MGIETSILVAAAIGVGGGMAVSSMMAGKSEKPKIESGLTGVSSVESGISASESRRKQVMTQMSKMQKATVLAKANQPNPIINKTTLGPGTV